MIKFFSSIALLLIFSGTAMHCKDADTPDLRDGLVGVYAMAQTCMNQPGDSLKYQITLSKSTDNNDRVIIDNFGGYGQGNFVYAEVAADQTLTIPSQEVAAGLAGNVTIKGNGQPDGNILAFDFNVFLSGLVDTDCQAQGSKL